MTNTITVESSGHECEAKLDTWLKDILPHTPGIVRKVAKRELVLACREFFEKSAAWRVVVGPKSLVANKRTYYTSPYDAYSDVVRVFSVELNGRPLKVMLRRPAGVEPDAETPHSYFIGTSPAQVRVWPTPSVSVPNGLTFYLALTPKATVTKLPSIALTHFYDAILDGVLGRILGHPAKPYSNPVLAQYHLRRFSVACGHYAAEAKKGFGEAVSWTFPRFGK
jgi:hypothetical protein